MRVSSVMGEKQKRQYLASEALLLGYGGISLVSRITGVSINTIRRGIAELEQEDFYKSGVSERIAGAGRPKFTDINTNISTCAVEIY